MNNTLKEKIDSIIVGIIVTLVVTLVVKYFPFGLASDVGKELAEIDKELKRAEVKYITEKSDESIETYEVLKESRFKDRAAIAKNNLGFLYSQQYTWKVVQYPKEDSLRYYSEAKLLGEIPINNVLALLCTNSDDQFPNTKHKDEYNCAMEEYVRFYVKKFTNTYVRFPSNEGDSVGSNAAVSNELHMERELIEYLTKEKRDLILKEYFYYINSPDKNVVNNEAEATVYANIAQFYKNRKLMPLALIWYERARDIQEKKDGENLLDTAKTYVAIAEIKVAQYHIKDALELYEKALRIYEKENYSDADMVRNRIARLSSVLCRYNFKELDQNEYPQAIEWYEKALATYNKEFEGECLVQKLKYDGIVQISS